MSASGAHWERVAEAYRSGRLGGAIGRRARPWILGSRYLLHNPAAGRVRLHAPRHVQPDPANNDLAARVLRAFRKMKADQADAAPHYRPAPLWQQQIDDAFSTLSSAARDEDVHRFHYFLANFGAWDRYHGVEHVTLVRNAAKSLITTRYVENEVFFQQLKVWQWFYNDRKPLDALTYPRHGNQSGAFVDGIFVGVASFFTEIYASMLSALLDGVRRPVVGELGGGYGRWAHFILRDLDQSTYVDFDLPETLCLAAYYLMCSFPTKRTLLYGEDGYSSRAHDRYDLIFMPSFEIERLGARSVDLLVNIASLGEMASAAADNYVRYIAAAVRHWFFHINHDVTRSFSGADGRAPLASEYPISPHDFRLLFRYPDLGSMLSLGSIDLAVDTFVHLYERRAECPAAGTTS